MWDFISTNWPWILLVGAMVFMHLGHGGHGQHGGPRDTPKSQDHAGHQDTARPQDHESLRPPRT